MPGTCDWPEHAAKAAGKKGARSQGMPRPVSQATENPRGWQSRRRVPSDRSRLLYVKRVAGWAGLWYETAIVKTKPRSLERYVPDDTGG